MSSRETTNQSRQQSTNEGGNVPSAIRQPPTTTGQQQPSSSSANVQQQSSTTVGPKDEGGAPWDTPTAWGGGVLHEKDALILDIFPSNPQGDIRSLESSIRSCSIPSVKWGEAFSVEPVAFGINKLRIQAICEGGKVETNEVQDKLSKIHGVKSVDFVAYTKC